MKREIGGSMQGALVRDINYGVPKESKKS